MEGAEAIMVSLHSKIEKLILLHKSSDAEVQRLSAENETLKSEIGNLEQQVSELEHQINNTQLTEMVKKSGFEKDELKLRLDAMIGEIDKCLTILNQ
jgi:phage shock protein A